MVRNENHHQKNLKVFSEQLPLNK